MQSDRTPKYTFMPSHLNSGVLLLGFIGTLWLTFTYDWATQMIGSFSFGSTDIVVPLPFFAIFPMLFLVLFLRESFDKRLILNDEYLLYLEGLLSWKERSVRLEYEKISEITIEQTLYQKFFGLGDVLVTALVTHSDSSVRMPGVRNPRDVKDVIRGFMKERAPS